MNKIKWAIKEFEWLGRRGLHLLTGNYHVNREKFAGKGIVPDEFANDFIYNGLQGDEPFAVVRTGFSEIGKLCCAQSELYYNSRVHYYWTPSYINGINTKDRGFLKKFYSIMMDSMSTADAIGTYPDMFMSDAVIENVPGYHKIMLYYTDVLTAMGSLKKKWTHALAGKRVLIVSPFYKEIAIQYNKRNLLWDDGRIPECELSFDPSIWVREKGFFESLDILSERVLKQEFDIALLSCGSLGTPLAAKIKQSGRKAVQMGSTMHILFGLKGKRWDNNGLYNEYWIRPGENTKPSYAQDLDGSTYW